MSAVLKEKASPRNAFDELLERFRSESLSQREKGARFENFTKDLLQDHPQYQMRFDKVWLWNEWPGKKGADTGIDLVAQEKDGSLCAIQCKNYQKNHSLQRSDIDSFLAVSGKKPFKRRLFVSTTQSWSDHAEAVLDDQKIPCERIGYSELASYLDTLSLRQLSEEKKARPRPKKQIRTHQKEALSATLKGFQKEERGKLIMACGTGKTYAALKIAEELTKNKKKAMVLFVVPSLSLLAQSMREWAFEKTREQIHFAVCSDAKVGKDDEDIRLVDLGWPATTDSQLLYEKLNAKENQAALRVVFSTYQSLEIVSQAQRRGARGLAPFDLIICDEAHRTTGIEDAKGKTSFFSQVHNNSFLQSHKRLYMTATPRIYGDSAKSTAQRKNIEVISMDDPEIYGPEFYRLDFSKAVNQNLLSDYKVLVLTVSQKFAAKALSELPESKTEGLLNVPEAGLMLGCYNALRYPEGLEEDGKPPRRHLKRAVAFTTTIKGSKNVTKNFPHLIDNAIKETYSKDGSRVIEAKLEHVDGSFNALKRSQLLNWLKEDSTEDSLHDATPHEKPPECRILSNARCLSEGIDVPALDAVIFLNPRRSQIDIVQAVGRVMRKAEAKEYGYVILPLVVEPGTSPEAALNNDKAYKPIWDVLQALRSHDDRFDSEINKLELNQHKPERIRTIGVDEEGRIIKERKAQEAQLKQMELNFSELSNAFYAKLVVKCGNRQYWEQWAQDVARIASAIKARIEDLLAQKKRSKTQESEDFRAQFADFLKDLQKSINPSITQEEAVDMLSQHIITQPVFDALFQDYAFSEHNPISQAMQKVVGYLEEQGLKNETKDLAAFYESVRSRAQGIDNLKGRQQVVIELYEKFFATAFPKVSEKLGIVYTPIELVDFVLGGANEVLAQEFGQSLSSEDVHILEPFVGTGSFLVRLLQNEKLLKDADLERKYKDELQANEIMLLAYYIATVNIENAYHDRLERASQRETEYRPFEGIVLTDSFQLAESEDKQGKMAKFFPVNSERVRKQQKSPIRVILGNPPWSAGQKSENDANKNLKYEKLDARIKESYVEHSSATMRGTLYDSYIRALRWASDRIGKEGVIAYVTNGSFLDANATDGLRQCLAKDFDRIYVLNLRGNARTVGEQNRKEGGLIFNKGRGSKATIAITFLVKNPKRDAEQAEILYHDIGDYLSREQKLQKIRENSIGSLDWQRITPNKSYDWIKQRDERFQEYLPLGTEKSKKGALKQLKAKPDEGLFPEKVSSQGSSLGALFGIYSQGVKTNRDTWVYNFSPSKLAKNMRAMIHFYNQQLAGYQKARRKDPKLKVEDCIDNDPKKISWTRAVKNDLSKGKEHKYSKTRIRPTLYRPFCKQWLYFDSHFNEVQYQQPRFFPQPDSPNLLICISGKGANQFSALMVDTLPDIQLIGNAQCFAFYVYDEKGQRHENITDGALALFQKQYGDQKITKEDLFYYAYAVLHWPAYRQKYSADLVKMLARIPFVRPENFSFFVKAGRELGQLHTQYEKQREYPLKIKGSAAGQPGALHLEKMRFAKDPALKSEKNKQGFDKSVIIFSSALRIEGIPLKAYEYVVNARPAIEWVMERYQKSTHKDSKITNDPNDWEGGAAYALSLLKRVVTVSMETVRIVKELGKVKM